MYFANMYLKILLLAFCGFVSVDNSLGQSFFTTKKEASYRIHYGFINAGELSFLSDTTLHLVEKKMCHKMAVTGKTTGAAAAFAKIDDRWITYVDTVSGLPFRFIRELSENNYAKEELTEFDRESQFVVVSTKTSKDEFRVGSYHIPPDAHDMVSAYLSLNAYPLDKMLAQDTIRINVFLEDSTFAFKIKYLGRETINTEYGKKEAYKIAPMMPENSIFSKEEDLVCWISADAHKIPLKFKAKLSVGAVEMELERYSGYEPH
jgi:hypothetical protein